MSQRSAPRHLARTRTSGWVARNRPAAATVAVLLLLLLAVAAARALDALGSRSAAGAPSTVATSAGSTVAPASTARVATVPGNLVRNAGFEAGYAGWRPIGGAGLALVDVAHEGGSAAKLTGGPAPNPGVAYPTVTTTRAKGATYLATAWVQASTLGVTAEIHLLEYVNGQRFAVFRSGLELRDNRWHHLQVAQLVHVKGSTLALEVVAPGLPGRAGLLVDDVVVRQAT